VLLKVLRDPGPWSTTETRRALPCRSTFTSIHEPSLRLAGTDIHEGPPDFNYVTTAPYSKNLGVIFIPSKNSWHGVGHHQIQGLRKSIIINYVSSEWRDMFELA
jgi:hypothetical protein